MLSINFWAVLVTAIANMILGSIWFGPLFGKIWMRLGNMTMGGTNADGSKKSMTLSYVSMFITSLIMAYVLASTIAMHAAYFQTSGIASAVSLAVFLWLGFVLPVTLGVVLWEGKSWKYWAVRMATTS